MMTRSKQDSTALILSACLAIKDCMALPRCSSRLVSWHTTSHAGGERHFSFLAQSPASRGRLLPSAESAHKKSRHDCRLVDGALIRLRSHGGPWAPRLFSLVV